MMKDKKFLKSFDKNIQGKFSYLPSRIKQMEVKMKDNLLRIDCNLPSDMFNILCCTGGIETSCLDEGINHFKAKKMPFAFWAGFEDEPVWLEEELLKKGLITEEIEWAMACDLNKNFPVLIKDDFELRKAQNEREILDVISVINGIVPKKEHEAIRAFYEQSLAYLLSKNCPLTFFIGYIDKIPMSISSSFCRQGLASIFDVIVLPDMRGKGIGKSMTLQAMLDAQKKGFGICILTATNDAKYLYEKLGFEELKKMKVYQESF